MFNDESPKRFRVVYSAPRLHGFGVMDTDEDKLETVLADVRATHTDVRLTVIPLDERGVPQITEPVQEIPSETR